MSYERFSQLWDALVTNRPRTGATCTCESGMSDATKSALIDYANGNKTKIEAVKKLLGR